MRLKGKQPIFNYRDTWSLDYTLSPIIAEGLKKFKEVIKTSDVAGYPSSFGLSEDTDQDNRDTLAFNSWLATIDKMIYAFEGEKNTPEMPNDMLYWTEEGSDVEIDFPKDSKPMIAYNIKHRDVKQYIVYTKAVEQHEAKVQEGLDLFAMHYKALWW